MILSFFSTTSIKDVAKESGSGLRWFQMYPNKSKELMRNWIERAESNGYKAIVVTVDGQILGRRLADMKNGFDLPSHLSLPNISDIIIDPNSYQNVLKDPTFSIHDVSATWDAIDWIRSETKLPVVVKGILTAEDALEAVRHNVHGIIVSNHGGRELDGVPATVSIVV